MRKFIISDIHGNGNLYYSVMSFLENISKEEDVILYINGDLIDRGLDSAEILLDVINRINSNNSFKIIYLAGNHELMMHRVLEKRRKNKRITRFNSWYLNGGKITDDGINPIDRDNISSFLAEIDLYHKFPERMDFKEIVLVHAMCPFIVRDTCNIKIKDLNIFRWPYVWAREEDFPYPFKSLIGSKRYFSIIGHTPNNQEFGYLYNKRGNYLNIDGGSACYVSGLLEYDHYPLVEIKDNYLRILTFNSNNEIIAGNYFVDNRSFPFNENELNQERSYLDKSFKPKKLVL